MLTLAPKKIFILSLLIVLAAVNACAYTPAIPEISSYFHQSVSKTQGLIVISLIAHCFSPLFFAALGNAFSRLRAIRSGLSFCFLGDFLCVFSAWQHQFFWLNVGMFCLSFGGNMGMTMALSLIRDQTIQFLEKPITLSLLSFALLPGLAITLVGGLLTFAPWPFIFVALAGYHAILWWKTPDVIPAHGNDVVRGNNTILSFDALKNFYFWKYIFVVGSLTGALYTFSAFAPRIALHDLNLSTFTFGLWSNVPSLGMLAGNLLALQFERKDFNKLVCYTMIFKFLGIGSLWLSLETSVFATGFFFIGVALAASGGALLYPLLTTKILEQEKDHASSAGLFTAMHFLIASQWVNIANHIGMNGREVLICIYGLVIAVLMIFLTSSSLQRDRVDFH